MTPADLLPVVLALGLLGSAPTLAVALIGWHGCPTRGGLYGGRAGAIGALG